MTESLKTNKTIELRRPMESIKCKIKKIMCWPQDMAGDEDEIRRWCKLPMRDMVHVIRVLRELEKERIVFLNICGYWQTVDPKPDSHISGYEPAQTEDHYLAAFGRSHV